jgi:hypothetical protein
MLLWGKIIDIVNNTILIVNSSVEKDRCLFDELGYIRYVCCKNKPQKEIC